MCNPKTLKRIAGKVRREKERNPALCHILINLRSNVATWYIPELNKELKKFILMPGKHREYTIKHLILEKWGNSMCLNCDFARPEFSISKKEPEAVFF